MKLTNNFSLSEFNSKDGAEMPEDVKTNIFYLADNLQVIRNECNCAIHINSAYRSKTHNQLIGGVKNSQHTKGTAADIVSRNHSPKELYNIIESLIERNKISEGGLGLYKSFVHYDVRGIKARW